MAAGADCSGERAGKRYLQYWLYWPDSQTEPFGERGYHPDDWESFQVRIGETESRGARKLASLLQLLRRRGQLAQRRGRDREGRPGARTSTATTSPPAATPATWPATATAPGSRPATSSS